MRRGKRNWKSDNVFIYLGTAIFILLAIALGVIMYMTSKVGVRIENDLGEDIAEQSKTESVTNEIGKTVEEQIEKVSEVTNNTNEEELDIKTESETITENQIIETKKELTFIKPAEGEIISEYAKDNLIYSETLKEWITHTAIDIKADKTSVIKASADGIIKSIVNDPRYGLTIIIEHDDGYETVYSNLLTAEFVVVGEEVKQGQTIATVGNTAAFESSMEYHIHFELLKDGEYVDPTIYFK